MMEPEIDQWPPVPDIEQCFEALDRIKAGEGSWTDYILLAEFHEYEERGGAA